MKRITLLFSILILALLLAACGASAQEDDGLTATEGRILFDINGTALLVTEDGSPVVLSVQAEGDDPFAGFSSGDRVSVTHDGIADSYPQQTGAYGWELLEKGTLEDIPQETLAALEELNWDFGRGEAHEPAEEPQTVDDPVSGYCGNTVTEVVLDEENLAFWGAESLPVDAGTYSFWGSDSVALTDLLINLDYQDDICRCLPEFTVNTEFGDGYGVNLTEHYVRYGDHQCPITEEQAELIRGVLERNCAGE